ncbi:heterokaryon incompatibility protein [Colletotrichum plurivorum]|uniref:Heterokaryon incompatibility protein n=1 Tax=Colletotrichum plurivorum TaxID=2175906 RepID=A0A8H6KX87_9PEZI|nr:heterokaryon incompatibility protein [Colletotrichum plurivorum]
MDLSSQDSPVPADESAAMSSGQERKLWVEEYVAATDEDLDLDSALIRQVESDYIDRNHIETEIQRLVPTTDMVGSFCQECSHQLDHWPEIPYQEFDHQFIRGRSFSSTCEIEAAARAGCKFCFCLTSLLIEDRLMDTFRKQGKTDMLELAKMWLRQCSDSHRLCRNIKEYNRPARLLSIDKSMARVVSTKGFGAMPQYATLSYCWGRQPFTTLTLDTMETFCQGFAICDLPKGDDDQDWVTESALMKDVYGNSHVNLAATSAINVREGPVSIKSESVPMDPGLGEMTFLRPEAGIARRQHEATGDQYLADMWRDRFVQQLPWRLNSGRRKRPAWRAPSWSWMSVDIQVWCSRFYDELNPSEVFKQYVQVLDVWTTPSGPDPFGQISDGLLSLACSALVGAQLPEPGNPEGTAEEMVYYRRVRLDGRNIELPVILDALEEHRTQDCQYVYLLPVLSGRDGLQLKSLYRYEREEREEEKENEEEIEDRLTVDGLVLRACGENAGNRRHFYRPGSFSFESRSNFQWARSEKRGKDDYHQFIHVLEEGESEASKAQDLDTGSNDVSPETYIRITIK